jgi:hypothetical protein
MEIVSGKCLNSIAFDRTEICTIIDNSDKKNGRYIVSNGSAKFEAFINMQGNNDKSPEYKVNDSVRVSIPNGDYSQKKYIEGLNVVDNSICPITYVSPLDSMLDITENIVPDDRANRTIGLRANDPNQSELCLWSVDLTKEDYGNKDIYDTISLQADFKTLLSGYNVFDGSYGLRLDMYVRPASDLTQRVKHTAFLDSSQMFGNPYSFIVYSTQAIKFNIADLGAIDTISLYFY